MSEEEDSSEGRLSYGDLFEDWEISVARRVAIQFLRNYPWLQGLYLNDLVQEGLIHWHFHRSSFHEGKGASAKTYMTRVLNTQLKLMLRQQLTDKRRASHMAESLDSPLDEYETTLSDLIPADELVSGISTRVDLESALVELTLLQRRICDLLSQDYPVKKIADHLGKPRSTVRDEIKRIRQIFFRKGLGDFQD